MHAGAINIRIICILVLRNYYIFYGEIPAAAIVTKNCNAKKVYYCILSLN